MNTEHYFYLLNHLLDSAETPPVAEEVRRCRGSDPVGGCEQQPGTGMSRRCASAETPPVAEEVRRCRGSDPVGGCEQQPGTGMSRRCEDDRLPEMLGGKVLHVANGALL